MIAMNILSFGEILWDVYPNEQCLGGAPLNFIAHAQRNGANGFLMSAVGLDELGAVAKKSVRDLGVDDRFVAKLSDKQTGKCIVSLDENGVPTYRLLSDVAYDYIPFDERLKEKTFDALAFGTLALRGVANRECVQSLINARIARWIYCDLNLRPPFYDKGSVEFCLRNANILKLSEDEVYTTADMFGISVEKKEEKVRALAGAFPNLKIIVVTLGEKGSFAYECERKVITYCKAVETEVVSTVGAGDAFGSAFLTAYLSGESVQECLQKGAKLSAFVVAHKEAIPKI